jgi:hypothetical protein
MANLELTTRLSGSDTWKTILIVLSVLHKSFLLLTVKVLLSRICLLPYVSLFVASAWQTNEKKRLSLTYPKTRGKLVGLQFSIISAYVCIYILLDVPLLSRRPLTRQAFVVMEMKCGVWKHFFSRVRTRQDGRISNCCIVGKHVKQEPSHAALSIIRDVYMMQMTLNQFTLSAVQHLMQHIIKRGIKV